MVNRILLCSLAILLTTSAFGVGASPLPSIESPIPIESPVPIPAVSVPLPEATGLADLGGVLMAPKDLGTASTVLVTGRIGNGGASTNASKAELRGLAGDQWATIGVIDVPPLGLHDQFDFNVSWTAPYGFTKVELVVDPADEVTEFDEENNVATTWTYRVHAAPIESTEPVWFEDGQGNRIVADHEETATGNGLKLVAKPRQGPAGVVLLVVHKEWLDSRVPSVALEDDRFEIAKRAGEEVYAIETKGQGNQILHFRSFEPGTLGAMHGRGSPASLLLDSRPMGVRLIEVPVEAARLGAAETPNGTVTLPTAASRGPLRIELEDGNHKGQDLWFKAAWFEQFGIEQPILRHDDGTPIATKRIGDYYYAQPQHFSVINAFDGPDLVFEKVADQPYSDVGYSGGTLSILADRRADLDETLLRNFVPHQQYTLAAGVGVTYQGNGQGAYPLAVGNRQERTAEQLGGDIYAFKSMGFYYNSQDCNLHQAPAVVAYYRGASGAAATVWTQAGPTGSSCGSQLNWFFTLRLRVTATLTYFEFLTAGGTVVQSTAVANSQLPVQSFDAIFAGGEDRCSCAYAETSSLWVDNVKVENVVGNFISSDFSTSLGWTTAGSATISGGQLQLTPNTNWQAGRAIYSTGSTGRFSAEFRMYVGPNSGAADGLAFMFYKNDAYTPAYGGALGFQDSDQAYTGHEGFGVEFDEWQNAEFNDPTANYLGLIRHTVNHADSFNSYYTPFSFVGGWHTINVDVFDSQVVIYADGQFKYNIYEPLDRTFSHFGFSAATGGASNLHLIDDVQISTAAAGSGPGPGPCPGPSNDCFAAATLVTGNAYSATPTNTNAVREAGEPQLCGSVAATVWYAWTPTSSGTATVSTVSGSTNYDTVLSAFTGNTLATLSPVGTTPCNDDHTGTQSLISFACSTGTTYRIQLGGYNGATGTAGLSMTCGGGGSGNGAPSPCMNVYVSGRTVDLSSCSSDPDNDPLSLTWNFGDGTTAYGDWPSHSYACPGGTYSIALTVSDGYNSPRSMSQTTSAVDYDSDGDGLRDCEETSYQTDPYQWDSDSDQMSDGAELQAWNGIGASAWNTDYGRLSSGSNNLLKSDADDDGILDGVEFAKSATIFGNCAGSNDCPVPNKEEIFIEVDWMVKPGQNCVGTTCAIQPVSYMPTAAQLNPIKTAFANRGIAIHFDTGQLGGGGAIASSHYRDRISFDGTANGVDFYDYKLGGNGIPVYFTPAKSSVFRYMLVANKLLTDSTGQAGGFDDDFLVAKGRVNELFPTPTQGGTSTPAQQDTATSGTIIHELGHALCLVNPYTGGRYGGSSACDYAGIDVNSGSATTYQSSMNYKYQFTKVDYSDGSRGTGDHNDWAAIDSRGVRTGPSYDQSH